MSQTTGAVLPVAPTVTVVGHTLAVSEDGIVALGISETPFDPHDPVSIKITGVPSDAALSAGTNNHDGSWTLTPPQLSDLTLTAGEVTQATLTVTATNTLGTTASSSTSIALTVNPVAPTLAIVGDELAVGANKTVALGISETPFDSTTRYPSQSPGFPRTQPCQPEPVTATEPGRTPEQLKGLTLTAGEPTQATLTVTATNTEGRPLSHLTASR